MPVKGQRAACKTCGQPSSARRGSFCDKHQRLFDSHGAKIARRKKRILTKTSLMKSADTEEQVKYRKRLLKLQSEVKIEIDLRDALSASERDYIDLISADDTGPAPAPAPTTAPTTPKRRGVHTLNDLNQASPPERHTYEIVKVVDHKDWDLFLVQFAGSELDAKDDDSWRGWDDLASNAPDSLWDYIQRATKGKCKVVGHQRKINALKAVVDPPKPKRRPKKKQKASQTIECPICGKVGIQEDKMGHHKKWGCLDVPNLPGPST